MPLSPTSSCTVSAHRHDIKAFCGLRRALPAPRWQPGRISGAATPAFASASPASAASSSNNSMAAASAERKLRFLCLHGFSQNGLVFKNRIGSFRKGLKKAEFVFMDAPFPVDHPDAQQLEDSDGTAADGRSWWQWTDVEPGTRPSRAAHYSGWEVSQAAITAALKEHAPIDGLLGFSQGATAAALYMAHAALEGKPRGPLSQLQLAILAAGFLPRDLGYAAALQEGRPALPTLFVYGEADQLVPEERTRQLWEAFTPGAVHTLKHPGAHWVPTCSGTFKQQIMQFLEVVQQQAQQQEGSGRIEAAAAAAAAATAEVAVL